MESVQYAKVRIPYFSVFGEIMLSKITSKNQITLPKAIMALVPKAEYFEVEAVNDRIMLTPVRLQSVDSGIEAVWRKMEALGITEADVADAVKWARSDRAVTGT